MKIALKKFLDRRLGIQIVKSPHRGIEMPNDVAYFLPNLDIETILDIGANDGSYAIECSEWFNSAQIHSFEPTPSTYSLLRKTTESYSQITPHSIGMGAVAGEALMAIHPKSTVLNRVINSENDLEPGESIERITLDTIDNWCDQHNVQQVSILKVDTEGHDLEVLHGAKNLLKNRNVALLNIECGVNPMNQLHVPLEDIKSFLESTGYFLFGFYEQIWEWKLNKNHLRRVNAVFVSDTLLNMNRNRRQ